MVSNTRRSNGTGIGVSIGFNPLEVMSDFTLVLWAEIEYWQVLCAEKQEFIFMLLISRYNFRTSEGKAQTCIQAKLTLTQVSDSHCTSHSNIHSNLRK